jgi:L-fuconolactonase
MRIDAHQHFWQFSEEEYFWIRPDWIIRRSYLPADLQPQLAAFGFDGSIAVQARQSLGETRWLLELARSAPEILGVVGWVDLRDKDVARQLEEFIDQTKFVGVRHVVQDEPDDFMLGRDFQRGIASLARFNLTYDILIYARQLPAAITLARAFPEQPFVLDHIGKPNIAAGELSPWREQLFDLARLPNVTCKLSGLVTEAQWNAWTVADCRPFLDGALEAFGAERLMFGSDWPVSLLAGTYEQVFSLIETFAAELSGPEQEALFGGNAAAFYFRR